MAEQYRWFVGIDWATESHEICVLDVGGRMMDRRTVEHTGAGIAGFIGYLKEVAAGERSALAVGAETPRGAIIESLVEHQFHVYSLNPKQMERFRDRHTVAGAKDDRRDALVIADSLRTDQHLFHRVCLDDALVVRIRELSRSEQAIQQQQVRVANQLQKTSSSIMPHKLTRAPLGLHAQRCTAEFIRVLTNCRRIGKHAEKRQ